MRYWGYALGGTWGRHIREAHIKGKKNWVNCWFCWLGYSSIISVNALAHWGLTIKKYSQNNIMNEVALWIMIVIGISLPPVIGILLDHYFKKKKLAAETKKIQLQNKITEEITYEQLKKDNKHKDIKNKIEILSRLTQLEEEIKNKTTKTDGDRKKLNALEALKEEFKETLTESKNEPDSQLLVEGEKKPKRKSKRTKKE